MRILFLGVQFEPEIMALAPFNTEMCRRLSEQGHEVTAVVGFPSYPQWSVAPEYRGRLVAAERHDGVRVLRVWQYVPHRPTALRRILFDSTFAVTSVLAALTTRRPDVVVATCSPLQLGASAAFLGALWRRPFVFHLQDLLPESATETGLVTDRRLVALAQRLADVVYARATTVSAIGHGILDVLRRRGVPDHKLAYLPNWTDLDRFSPATDDGAAWRERHGIPRDAFVAMYIGNFGVKQDMSTVVRAAALLQDRPDVHVVLVGGGSDHERVAAVAAELRPANLHLLPVQPAGDLAAMAAAADVFLLHQIRQVVDMVVPSKLLTYGAAARPVVMAGNPRSEGARFVEKAVAGPIVEAESPEALAAAVRALQDDPEARREYGENARRHVEEHFAKPDLLERFEQIVATAARRPRPRLRDRLAGRLGRPVRQRRGVRQREVRS